MTSTLLALVSHSIAVEVWFWATCLIGLVWLRRHLHLNRARREPALTPEQPVSEPETLPVLSVLVAAKDEQAGIAGCLAGLLAQDYPRLQVIAIDDRSVDRTGAIIDELAAHDSRLTALHVTELPEGWFGKNNAMRAGVARAAGEWLCFTDADCTYESPRLLSTAVRFALHEQVEFLSLLPRLVADSFWERVVQPVAGAILVFWNPPQKVNDPRSACAYANGAFMLLSRAAYERLGGHEPVKATLNEDMHLARRAKRLGVRLRVVRTAGLYSVRMYVGFRQIWRGWTRIFFGCFGTLPRLLASVALLSIFSLSPYVSLLLSPLGGPSATTVAAAALAAVLAQQSVLWRFYGVAGVARPWALTYPLGAVLCLGMTGNATLRAAQRGTTVWRGTTYRGGAKVSHEPRAADDPNRDRGASRGAPGSGPSSSVTYE